MPTGTPGPDNLRIETFADPNAFGLAGNDSITVSFFAGNAGQSSLLADGGDDFDTLFTEGMGQIAGTGAPGQFTFRSGANFNGLVTFVNMEQTFITASLWLDTGGRLITGDSHDTISFGGTTAGSGPVQLTLLGGNDSVILSGVSSGADIDLGTGNDSVDFSAVTPNFGATFSVNGGDGNDRLIGGAGIDIFVGGIGDDVLNGLGGADSLAGGTGNDIYVVDGSDTLIENSGEGFDLAFATNSVSLAAGVEIELLATLDYTLTTNLNLAGNELNNAITGNNGSNYLSGLAGSDYLTGLEGDDVLDGGADADIMEGGLGNDSYFVDTAFDIVRESAGAGLDIIYSSVSLELAAGLEVEVLSTGNSAGTGDINYTGNELNNNLVGNAGVNWLFGGAGDDYLESHAGNDLLNGGAGADFAAGGAGNDIYYVDNIGDVVLELADEGFDVVYASADVTLRSGQSVEVVSTANSTSTFAVSFTGNETNNNLVGNDGANTLRGEGGNDYLEGRGGADILDGGAGQDILEGGAGADTFRFAAASDTAFGAGDRIADFQSGLDKIDLSLIDANGNVPSDQQFAYIGSGAFTGSAGQLRSDTVGGPTHVYGDVNGDSVADFHFVVNVQVTAGDFIL